MPNPPPPPSVTDETDDGFDDDSYVCTRCDGEGLVMICIDDMCHGAGECFHGDGYATCPRCKGAGELDPRRR